MPVESFKVKLTTGDKVNLASDVNTQTFSAFTSFKSTQFFLSEFAESSDLLTTDVTEEPELSWFEQESAANMPNWVLILLIGLACIFTALGIFVCVQSRRNKSKFHLQ